MKQTIKIMLVRDVERFPDFIAKMGSTGTVIEYTQDSVVAKMDAPINGCEHWDNCIIWEGDYRKDFESDATGSVTLEVA